MNLINWLILYFPRKIFIAGKTRQDAISTAIKLSKEGFGVTIDTLGECAKNSKIADLAVSEYKKITDDIKTFGVNGTISIKLTQLGLSVNRATCLEKSSELVEYGLNNGVFVEFDMESSIHEQDIISIFKKLCRPSDNCRICLQANLKNSVSRLSELTDNGYQTRLVKGAYKEKPEISFQKKDEIISNFMMLIDNALKETRRCRSQNLPHQKHVIATRNRKVIDFTRKKINEYGLNKDCIEFQLLYGYLGLGRELLKENYEVRIYTPFGDDRSAYPYIWRRLKTWHNWILFLDYLKNLCP